MLGMEGANAVSTEVAPRDSIEQTAELKECDSTDDRVWINEWVWSRAGGAESRVVVVSAVACGKEAAEGEEERIIWSLKDTSSFLNASTVALQREYRTSKSSHLQQTLSYLNTVGLAIILNVQICKIHSKSMGNWFI